jgi:large-conductance mechanosensitive channel
MKRTICFLFLIVILSHLAQSGGVGITPAYYKDFFEPNMEKEYKFRAFNLNSDKGISLFVEGGLKEYVELSDRYFLGSGEVIASVKLPQTLSKPGTHRIYVGAIESDKDNIDNVGGIAAIQGRIDIIVPYPGKYTESRFKISNVNEGEDAAYELEIDSLGTQSVKVKSKIQVFDKTGDTLLLSKVLPEKELESKETYTDTGTIDTSSLVPGEYKVYATVEWEVGETIHNSTLRVGEFFVEIIDYDYEFERGKINPFNIEVQNKWNSEISEVYASVSISEEGKILETFKTVTVDTRPWEKKNITGYLDTNKLESKRYTARIVLSYGQDGETIKLVAIYVNDPPKEYNIYMIGGGIVGVIIIAIFIYLIMKIRKLQNQNKQENKNEKKETKVEENSK